MKKTTLILSVLTAISVFFLVSCQSGKKSELQGYKTTKSGLLYKIIEHGSDTTQPNIGSYLDVDMSYGTGDTILFDSRTLPPQQKMHVPMVASVHQGDIYEGFSLMHVGDSAEFAIVADSVWTKLFHMPKAPPEFDSVKYLYFNVRLKEVISRDEEKRRNEEEQKEAMDSELKERTEYLQKNYPNAKPTESGLYYIQETKGHGKSPEKGDMVSVNYTGKLLDGTVFDSSLDRGKPIEFPLGQGRVIRGWDEGIGMMNKGEKAILIIPSELAYGPRGSGSRIKPYSTLVFEVELVDFTKKEDKK